MQKVIFVVLKINISIWLILLAPLN